MSESSSGFSQPAIGGGPVPARAGLLAARDFLEVRFGGTADQGVVLMGLAVATAATRDHRYVAETQSYGLEDLGGHGHSDVIISDDPVDYPELQGADLLVALCQASADAHVSMLRADGVFVYDSGNVTEPPHFEGASFGIPFADLAQEVAGEDEPAPELLALGAVVAITGVVSVDSLQKTLKAMTVVGSNDAGVRALSRGLALHASDWRWAQPCS
jgi:2-oxoglutarate ferredoxin oxidoreductase subunit gamma